MKTERLKVELAEPGDGDLVDQYSALLTAIEPKLFMPDAQTAELWCNEYRITDLATPTLPNELARKTDVDALGISPIQWLPLDKQLWASAGNKKVAAGMVDSTVVWMIDDVNGWQQVFTGLNYQNVRSDPVAASEDELAFVLFNDSVVFVDTTANVTVDDSAPYADWLVWSGEAWVISTTAGDVYVRTDAGWSLAASLPSLWALSSDGAGTLVGTKSNGDVLISRDGGWTWEPPVDIGINTQATRIALIDGRWFLTFFDGQVRYSDDLQTFNTISNPLTGVWVYLVESRGALIASDIAGDLAVSIDGETFLKSPKHYSVDALHLGGTWPVIMRNGGSTFMRTPVVGV